jgi:hypothetical protein
LEQDLEREPTPDDLQEIMDEDAYTINEIKGYG